MDRLKHLKSRKDARLIFSAKQNVAVRCLTNACRFNARIKNVSSSGIFISTNRQLPLGEEIAVSFAFPDSGHRVRATGKVVRVTGSGIGIEIQVYFKENGNRRQARKKTLKSNPSSSF